ncbi:uncharacterized protein VTP21DRAFT_8225 [Calcarisporiella thermophila]|uniref:uncharacterized protein n=1 Tax=Calcarisporiella thermophila TaxID=911321 RepID=UPI003743A385
MKNLLYPSPYLAEQLRLKYFDLTGHFLVSEGLVSKPANTMATTDTSANFFRGFRSLGVGQFRKITLWTLQDLFFLLFIAKIKSDISKNPEHKFQSHSELPYNGGHEASDIKEYLRRLVKNIFLPEYAIDSTDKDLADNANSIIEDAFSSQSVGKLVKIMLEAVQLIAAAFARWECAKTLVPIDVSPDAREPSLVNFVISEEVNRIIFAWRYPLEGDLLAAVSQMLQIARDESRQLHPVEYIFLHLAYQQLANGELPKDTQTRFLGTSGFRRDTQTYMSLTDPGDGHIFGTSRYNEWMRGAIVHVEHLERPNHFPREMIESYRISSILDFARTRLHVGSNAPITYFVGRMLKDYGKFDLDFIKVVNTTSAAATSAFQLGAAECKVAMDGLTTSQMVRYMKGLSGHTLRNCKQYLSAAFNLNTPLVDDLPPYTAEDPKIYTNQREIGLRGIELAAMSGFDKVTWDGASDSYPSKCVMEQLGFQDALELVHRAHEQGLVTYFSAGFKFHNIELVVYTGVDGVGIGGAQILRFMDHQTGMHGPYLDENIPEILRYRDDAAATIRGRGVHILTRLDRMYFEGSITEQQNSLRLDLYDALYNVDETKIEELLNQLESVARMPDDGETPYNAYAKRLVQSEKPLLSNYLDQSEWQSWIEKLTKLIGWGNEAEIVEEYMGETWMHLRKKYRHTLHRRRSFLFKAKISS